MLITQRNNHERRKNSLCQSSKPKAANKLVQSIRNTKLTIKTQTIRIRDIKK